MRHNTKELKTVFFFYFRKSLHTSRIHNTKDFCKKLIKYNTQIDRENMQELITYIYGPLSNRKLVYYEI